MLNTCLHASQSSRKCSNAPQNFKTQRRMEERGHAFAASLRRHHPDGSKPDHALTIKPGQADEATQSILEEVI